MEPGQHDKYSRQILFAGVGEAGQEKLLGASAVVVGCGALGTVVANLLVRAGVGRLRIVDRDFVEPSNLQRQTLFEEADARDALPKAVAAERRLRAINSGAQVEGIVADVTPRECRPASIRIPLILDGTDNFETRLLVNDTAVSLGNPVDLRSGDWKLRRDDDHPPRRIRLPRLPARVRRGAPRRRRRRGLPFRRGYL